MGLLNEILSDDSQKLKDKIKESYTENKRFVFKIN